MTNADKATGLVLGDRNASYGNPADDFHGTGLMWTGLLNEKLRPGAGITATDVALMMTALKLRRYAHKPKDDSLIDAHGYLLCAEWVEKGAAPEPLAEVLGREIASLHETIEDVATGASLTCPTCNKPQPCLCGNGVGPS